MPKPVKKAVRKLKVPPKTKRSSDPNRAAHAMLAEHMARVQSDPTGVPEPANFEMQYRAHMSKLGTKGGRVSGRRRMDNLTDDQRREIAAKAARARWSKAKAKAKRV